LLTISSTTLRRLAKENETWIDTKRWKMEDHTHPVIKQKKRREDQGSHQHPAGAVR